MSATAELDEVNLHKVADSLCQERQDMLVMFCRVAGLEPFNPTTRDDDTLQNFCQILIDYTAFSHFEFFDRIAHHTDLDQSLRAEMLKAFSGVSASTEVALAFNDKYALQKEPLDGKQLSEQLAVDLSELGQTLAERAELEDHLISQLRAA